MSISALVYKNRSLSQDDRARIGSKDLDTGQPLLRAGDTYYSQFAAKELFIGNLLSVAALRRELEQNAPEMSKSIREFVLSNGTLVSVAISEPNVSRIASECSDLLDVKRFNLSEYLRNFLTDLNDMAKIALNENSPIVLV